MTQINHAEYQTKIVLVALKARFHYEDRPDRLDTMARSTENRKSIGGEILRNDLCFLPLKRALRRYPTVADKSWAIEEALDQHLAALVQAEKEAKERERALHKVAEPELASDLAGDRMESVGTP